MKIKSKKYQQQRFCMSLELGPATAIISLCITETLIGGTLKSFSFDELKAAGVKNREIAFTLRLWATP
jgi:hypothetical protein